MHVARDLGMSRATLYQRIRDLEAATSNEFLNRSTPPITTMERVSLTLHQTRGLTVRHGQRLSLLG